MLRESHTIYSKLTSSNLFENINTLAIKKNNAKMRVNVNGNNLQKNMRS